MKRLELIEHDLANEREKALSAQTALRQQDTLRLEVEGQLKAISQQLRREKDDQERREAQLHDKGRVEVLERRLDEMHQTWVALLKEMIARRDQEAERESAREVRIHDQSESLDKKLQGLAAEVEGRFRGLSDLPDALERLKAELSAALRTREEGESRLAGRVEGQFADFSSKLLDRLASTERRLALEGSRQEERAQSVLKERQALQEAVELQRHQVRQEAARGQLDLTQALEERLAQVHKALSALEERARAGEAASAQAAQTLGKLQFLLTQPPQAKDELIREIELEKQDLLKALRQRSEELRSYTLERREVERTMGESLMDLNRRLEEERSRQSAFQAETADLRLKLQLFESQKQEGTGQIQERDRRLAVAAAERDRMAQILAAQEVRMQEGLKLRLDTEGAWAQKFSELEGLLKTERHARLSDAQVLATLRTEIETLTRHLAATLNEKEEAQKLASRTTDQTREMEESLRKKEEMLSMLSTTLQNLLQKPPEV